MRYPAVLSLAAALALPATGWAATPFKMRVPVGTNIAAAGVLTVPGYNPATGLFRATGAFTYDPATATYEVAASRNGVPVRIGLPLAASAPTLVLAGMRDNPTAVPGTAGATYLGGQGIQWDAGVPQWVRVDTSNGSGYPTCTCDLSGCAGTEAYVRNMMVTNSSYGANSGGCQYSAGQGLPCEFHNWNAQGTWVGWGPRTNWNYVGYYCSGTPVPATAPLPPESWATLPSPIPAVGAELPTAPYLPQGVPINNSHILDLDTGATITCSNGGCW